jgi:hypothetical protein
VDEFGLMVGISKVGPLGQDASLARRGISFTSSSEVRLLPRVARW